MRIVKLARDHDLAGFDSGVGALDRFLTRSALQGQQAGASQTYVALDGSEIVGFHTLAVGSVGYDDAPPRLVKGMPRHPVPVMVLARLAVAGSHRGRGLGTGLLKDAMLRTLAAADIAGIRAMIVHAKDDATRVFYERFNFVPWDADPLDLFILLKDIRAWVGAT